MKICQIGAAICLFLQIMLIVLGIYILLNNPSSDFVKYRWYILIPMNVVFGIVNIKTISMG